MDDVLQEGWQAELPEDLRENETLAGVSTLSGLSKMLVHAQSMVGKDKVIVPGEGATEEDLNTFYDKLGRPKTAADYDLTPPEGLSYGDDELVGFRDTAHKLGLSATQTKALFDWHGNLSIEKAKADSLRQKEELSASEATLKKEWGGAYDQNFALAMKAVRTFTDEGSLKALEQGLGNDPSMVKLMHKVGEAISEDKLKGDAPIYTPGENKDAINKIMGDLNHPYHNKKHPGHEAAVVHVQKLYSALYPDE